MKKYNTVEECFAAMGLDPNALPDVSMLPERHQNAIKAAYQLMIVCEAHNDGWKPNWNDWNEYKYYPWFRVEADEATPSGSGLSYVGYDYRRTHTCVGSRLCLKTRDLAEHVGNVYNKLYQDYMLYSE